jgi:hypothetical protein
MTSLSDSRKTIRSSAAKALRLLRNVGQRFRNRTVLILSIVLLILTIYLLNLIVTQTFKPYFNCAYLVGSGLHMDQLCNGVGISFDILGSNFSFPILPALKAIDPPLEVFRRFITWNIVLFFALLSLVLAYISSKIIGFARLLLTPEGRKIVLTNLSIWLFFFMAFCTLFYFGVVR